MLKSADTVARILAEETGYPANVLRGRVDLTELGFDDSMLPRVVEKLSKYGKFTGLKPERISTVEDLVEWYGPKTTPEKFESAIPEAPVVSGVSLGVPGMSEVFDEGVWDAILAGRNLISELSTEMKQKLVDKKIVRLVKSEDGTSRLVSADTFETVPQLAGRGGVFDLIEQYGIDPKLVEAFDIATSLAFASGLEALRDAGLPLFPIEQTNSSGMRVIRRWALPESERDRTGVIFASVFPGLEKAIEHALKDSNSEESQFDRKYLLQVLSMGHSQFASWVGARGPNLAINNACASTPAAFAIAEDWMARGRCDRVIIVSGDDSTSDTLMPWIGSGFAGAGAHAMGNTVEEVALPFDARRHGMLLGMGGAGFVLERLEDTKDRGIVPYVELLGAEIANSAFHPTRLDTEHAASVMESFVSRMEDRWGLERTDMANRMTFMSHEPYTPPRGGSASAEVSALRHVFGRNASDILITNAKGYTGHPMGVGLEDAVVIRGLAAGILPPVANHMVDDPALGTLNLCKGGQHNLDLALRHGAGFGSQIALTLMRRIAVSDTERFDINRISNWTLQASGGTNVDLRVIKRKLVAYVDADENLVGGIAGEEYSPEPISELTIHSKPDENIRPIIQPAKTKTLEIAPATKPKSAGLKIPSDIDDTRVKVLEIVAEFTGYPQEFIEMDADMEGELGIDSIKQAEIMAEIRSTFALPLDEEFQLRDHPTLAHILVYISSMNGVETTQQPDSGKQKSLDAPVPRENSNVTAEPVKSQSDEEILSRILPIVVLHTGYPQEFIEMDADMEGELGIDSIKQAEIMSDIRSEFNLEVDEGFQIRDHPTLGHVVSYVSGFNGGETTLPRNPGTQNKNDSYDFPEIHRHRIEIENMAPLAMGNLPSQILITRDQRGVADALSLKLQPLGVSPIFVDEGGNKEIRNVDTAVIHLTPLDAEGTLTSDPDPLGWAVSTHSLLKDFDTNADLQFQTFVTVSALDGAHGFSGGDLNSAAAGAHGVAMSYGRERPNVTIRAVDLNPELLDNPESAALAILAEMTRKTGPIEVGIDADLKRQRIALRISDAPSPQISLNPSDVWIVSGGAAGVTAECMIRLASSEKSDSPTFILLGRTALDPELANLANSDEDDMEDEKTRLKQHLDSISSSGKVTLKQWDDAWQSKKRAIGIHSTLSRLRAAGAIAEYVSVDVTSRTSVDTAIDSIIRNYGPITGIVHGAGIEDSTPFDSKSDEIVQKVMGVKVGGWLSIYDSISSRKQPVRFACSFTSVAGRLGNAAQLDYCAANRILDAEHTRISSEDTVSISIAWSPWAGAGMATRGSLETVFDRAGVDMIPVDEGARMFVEEVLGSAGTPVLIAGKMGSLDHRKSVRRKEVHLPPSASSNYGDPLTFPMIQQILKCDIDVKAVASIVLDPDSHTYLRDHSISGVPYFPGVMALEMMAETVSLCSNNGKVASFENVEFGIPVKITRGTKEIRCTVESIQHDGAEIAFSCTIESMAPGGRKQSIIHHKAIAILRPSVEIESIPDIIPEEEDGSRILASADIYNHMFHGPRFQPLIGVVASIQNENSRGIEARVHAVGDIPNPELFNMGAGEKQPKMIAHPMLIESCFQAAGLTSMDIDGTDSLPVGARRIVLPGEISDGSITVLSVRTGSSPDSSTLHDSVIRLDGTPVLKIDDLMMKSMTTLDASERPGLIDVE
jgi:3-oxoacyl-(acyl-carrier-protein) synthase/acyl carrier protein/NAD(P)-dependent dehydrogenase (short-subunit alcohol dehydrogenase family)